MSAEAWQLLGLITVPGALMLVLLTVRDIINILRDRDHEK